MTDNKEDVLSRFLASKEELEKELQLLNKQIEDLSRRRDEILISMTTFPDFIRKMDLMDKSNRTFVTEIVMRRTVLGLSAKKLSLASGIAASYVSVIENGHSRPSDEIKEKIRKTLTRMEEDAKNKGSQEKQVL